jgi:capsular polysaccharide biosynthesis protein
VPQWLDILAHGQAMMNAGDAKSASHLFRKALVDFAKNPSAADWLTFNLMQSECQQHGPLAARSFVRDLLSSSINWSAKLYVIELAFSSLQANDPASQDIIRFAANVLSQWQWQPGQGDAINIISCQGLVRHLRRVFPGADLPPAFSLVERGHLYPIQVSWSSRPTPPTDEIECNRWPRALRTTLAAGIPAARPLGFRRVGRAFMLRDGENTIIFDEEGRVLDTPYGPLPRFLREGLERGRSGLTSDRRIEGASLFIGDFFSQSLNYCHWMLDSMPRLIAAHGAGLGFNHVVGGFAQTEAFQTWSLQGLLKKGEDYVGITGEDGLVEIENLYFADNYAIEHLWHPAYAADINLLNALRERLSGTSVHTGRRLYVPRRHNRMVSNEAALLELLTAYGFETIETDNLTPNQSAAIFAGAEAVVAPHGAALTHLLFAPPTTRVLEFFPAFGGSASFYRLATALGMDYSCLIDDTSHGPDRDETEIPLNNKSGILADLNFVAQWLRTRLNSPHQSETNAPHTFTDERD